MATPPRARAGRRGSLRGRWGGCLANPFATDYNDLAGRRRLEDRDDGLVWQKTEQGRPRARIFLRSWSDVLDENTQRLDFLPGYVVDVAASATKLAPTTDA